MSRHRLANSLIGKRPFFRQAFRLLKPHVADFFDFVDMEEGWGCRNRDHEMSSPFLFFDQLVR